MSRFEEYLKKKKKIDSGEIEYYMLGKYLDNIKLMT
jgi:hypothetical protein